MTDREEEGRAPVIVVAGLAMRGDTMLMQHRPPGRSRPLMWENPGGKVERDESSRYALAREWQEELGVDIAVGRHIVTVRILVEVTLEISLYAVTLPDGEVPQPLHATELMWAHPLSAIRSLPCAPATYLFYRHIRDYMERR